MGFFMVIVMLVFIMSVAAVTMHFVNQSTEIKARHKLEIEREKTKQLELSAKIVDDFDPEKVAERLKSRPSFEDIKAQVEKQLREMFAFPNRIPMGEQFIRERPTIYQEALTEEEMEIYRHYFEDDI